jgi:hypothetical protein
MFGTNGLEVPHILTQICTRFPSPTVDLEILGSCVCGSSKVAKKKKFKKCWILLQGIITIIIIYPDALMVPNRTIYGNTLEDLVF